MTDFDPAHTAERKRRQKSRALAISWADDAMP